MKPLRRLCLALALIFSVSTICWGWQGKVTSVTEGDTITVLHDAKKETIRLYGVDCPERGQDFAENAKRFTSDRVKGRQIDVRKVSTEQYGGTFGIVSIDGVILNKELVRFGYAWVYKQYCTRKECSQWRQLEDEARRKKLGLWILPVAIPPWEFRRYEKKGKSAEAGEQSIAIYHGDVRTHVFHAPGCEDFNCKTCFAVFKSRQAAIQAGYVPCGKCNP